MGTDNLNKLKKAMGESYSNIMLLAFFLLLYRTQSCNNMQTVPDRRLPVYLRDFYVQFYM